MSFRFYFNDFDLARRAVLQGQVQTVPESRVVQQAVQQAVLQQAGLLLQHHLLQLRAKVPVQLQATQDGQQPHQVGTGQVLDGKRTIQLPLQSRDGQLEPMVCQLQLESVD